MISLLGISWLLLIFTYMIYKTESEGRKADASWYQLRLWEAEQRLNHAREAIKRTWER